MRVHTAKAAKDYPDHDIKKGDTYYWWTPYRAGKRMSKTMPRQSQLTGSESLSACYAAGETITMDIVAGDDLEALADALDNAKDELDSAKEMCDDAYNNLPDNFQQADQGQALETRRNACEEWISALDDIIGEIREMAADDDRDKDDDAGECEAFLERAQSADPGFE